ncbi:PadR family transcriptional regulator [Weissella fangxianensis]|uniref:PadR family transcriptional regulator n=1 Tax=Weissella fangxianensis TaxID=2953879 RepID=UPI0021589D24|nr:PadR family transcriptional regulator [Weissella fangxianensis]
MRQGISSQMLKGILQGVILMILSKEPEYGYSLSKKMNSYGLEDIPKGTIYPLLTAMQKRGLIEGKNKASDVGPTRKYYFITENGQAAKIEFIKEWQQLQQSVNLIVEEEEPDEH